jgi:starch synthase (maltosyl-transferring)
MSSIKQAFHIEEVRPSIDCGRFAIKRIVGEPVEVSADIYRDGHDVIAADLIWRCAADNEWRRAHMTPEGNDRWVGFFVPDKAGRYTYAIEAWTDEFATWRHGFEQKLKANVATDLDAMEGASLLTHAVGGCKQTTAKIASACQAFLETGKPEILLCDELKQAMVSGQLRRDLCRTALNNH